MGNINIGHARPLWRTKNRREKPKARLGDPHCRHLIHNKAPPSLVIHIPFITEFYGSVLEDCIWNEFTSFWVHVHYSLSLGS